MEDIAEGLVACALRGKAGEIYNLASGEETTILDLAERINRLTGNPTPIDLKPARDWDRSGKRYGDPSKARDEIDFATRVGIEEGLERTIGWTRENRGQIVRCIMQHKVNCPELDYS